ncbi:MAG: A/G-specific adenine glycosylase [Cyclobacteriaceae bacterium]
MYINFSSYLISWYNENKRELPWRESRDPYVIWLSEIILQQTRVAQGLPYFYRFLEKYPNLTSLAEASESDVLRMWQGLGYYSRARNMLICAQTVSQEFNGIFPADYLQLRKLPGIGPYTAAAIASIAFKIAVPVIDGNVLRVMARYLAIEQDVRSPDAQNIIQKHLQEFIDPLAPNLFNQALMELGALICKPGTPDCIHCPLQLECAGFRKGIAANLPIKSRKTPKRHRFFHYFVFDCDGDIFLKKRVAGDIWQGMYDFLLVELTNEKEIPDVRQFSKQIPVNDLTLKFESDWYKHILTHQHILIKFHVYDLPLKASDVLPEGEGLKLYSNKELEALPKPVPIVRFLKEFFIN